MFGVLGNFGEYRPLEEEWKQLEGLWRCSGFPLFIPPLTLTAVPQPQQGEKDTVWLARP